MTSMMDDRWLPAPADDSGYERLDGPIEPHIWGSPYCEKFCCNAAENDPIHDFEDPEEFGF